MGIQRDDGTLRKQTKHLFNIEGVLEVLFHWSFVAHSIGIPQRNNFTRQQRVRGSIETLFSNTVVLFNASPNYECFTD